MSLNVRGAPSGIPELPRRSDNRLLPSLSRVTPSAASEHFSELLGCPISRSLTACCVCLELRPLPSTGITRLPRYYEPLRHPSAPGLSLAGVRLIIPDHAVGLPVLRALSLCTCCRHYPGAAAGRTPRSSHPAVSAFPGRVAGSACTSSFSRLAQRLLALRPAHSRGHQFVTRYPKASDISSPPCLLRLLPAGAVAGWGLHPLESAALSRRTRKADVRRSCSRRALASAGARGRSRLAGIGSISAAAGCTRPIATPGRTSLKRAVRLSIVGRLSGAPSTTTSAFRRASRMPQRRRSPRGCSGCRRRRRRATAPSMRYSRAANGTVISRRSPVLSAAPR